MKRNALILITFIIVSCAPSKTIALKYRTYDEPAVNTSQTTELGERLVLKGEEYYQEALQITQAPGDITISMAKYPYRTGDVLPLRGSNQQWNLYYLDSDNRQSQGYYHMGIAKNKKDPNIIRPFVESTAGFASKRVDGFSVKETTYSNSKCANCFKQELIYNGKVGNNMKFIYREFIEDLARPSFTQELQYDLSESNTIGFKGARLEIEKATNTSITYKVVSSFTKG